MGRIYGRGS